jgi:peptide/nickel transport system substrate-binding protein
MWERKEHPYIAVITRQFAEGKVNRREFLRTATLLGMSAAAAYAFVGRVTGESVVRPARAEMPKGGTLRISARVKEVKNPHAMSWTQTSNLSRQVCEYLTMTGPDNITRPYLCERWEASADLRTWTLHLRKGVKWHSGRDFTADDAVWNIKQVLDAKTGSSVLGLMKGYMLEEYDEGGTTHTRLWDANAVEKVDDFTIRLNCKVPQVAVPEHLFHYPLAMLDPGQGGVFDAGSNGTGPFDFVVNDTGRKAVFKARKDYWGEGPYVDSLEIVDLGDEPSATLAALTSKQVHGLDLAETVHLETMGKLKHVQFYEVLTAQALVVRGKVDQKPFNDPRLRKALRLAVDQQPLLGLALRDHGGIGEHHHVAPIHPDYCKLPVCGRNVDEAKRLLADAGYPNGVDLEIVCANDEKTIVEMVQGMVNQWKDANIRVKMNVVPGPTFWDSWTKHPFSALLWAHRPLGVMVLGLAYRTGVPWNESSYANPKFDELLTKAEGILDVDKRREVICELEKIMQEDGPIVQPLWRSLFTFMDKRVKGFTMHPTNYIFGWQLGLEPSAT